MYLTSNSNDSKQINTQSKITVMKYPSAVDEG